jgi:hypothetical protein
VRDFCSFFLFGPFPVCPSLSAGEHCNAFLMDGLEMSLELLDHLEPFDAPIGRDSLGSQHIGNNSDNKRIAQTYGRAGHGLCGRPLLRG